MKVKAKRATRDAENDDGHNAQNHMKQGGGGESESESESEDGSGSEKRAGGSGAAVGVGAGVAVARKKRPAPEGAGGGGGGGGVQPAKARKENCCSVCRQPGHQKKSCPDIEYAKEERPKPTLNVKEGDVMACFDIECDAGLKIMYEYGSCLTKFRAGKWRRVDGESEVILHHNTINSWCQENCAGLLTACQKSTKTIRQGIDELNKHLKNNNVKVMAAHNALTTDISIMATHAADNGIDLLAEWKEIGVVGLIDTAVVIPKYKVTQLQHPPNNKHKEHYSYLSNSALFKMATGKAMEEDSRFSHHRALDDSKAEREWMEKLQPMSDLLFGEGAHGRPVVISIDDLQAWFAQKQKHRAYKHRKGLS